MTSVKLVIAAVSTLLLASCGSKPLTDTECQTLILKEIDFLKESMPAEDRDDSMAAFMSRDIPSKVSRCVSSQKSSRKYYKCMVAAKGASEMRVCMDEEERRNR